MIDATEELEAWCPPTFSPSRLGRIWFELWIVQADSHRIFCSSSRRIGSCWRHVCSAREMAGLSMRGPDPSLWRLSYQEFSASDRGRQPHLASPAKAGAPGKQGALQPWIPAF